MLLGSILAAQIIARQLGVVCDFVDNMESKEKSGCFANIMCVMPVSRDAREHIHFWREDCFSCARWQGRMIFGAPQASRENAWGEIMKFNTDRGYSAQLPAFLDHDVFFEGFVRTCGPHAVVIILGSRILLWGPGSKNRKFAQGVPTQLCPPIEGIRATKSLFGRIWRGGGVYIRSWNLCVHHQWSAISLSVAFQDIFFFNVQISSVQERPLSTFPQWNLICVENAHSVLVTPKIIRSRSFLKGTTLGLNVSEDKWPWKLLINFSHFVSKKILFVRSHYPSLLSVPTKRIDHFLRNHRCRRNPLHPPLTAEGDFTNKGFCVLNVKCFFLTRLRMLQ